MSEEDKAKSVAISPKWMLPDEVMRFHWMKQKKKKLQARMMNRTDGSKTIFGDEIDFSGALGTSSQLDSKPENESPEKRKNPFRCKFTKRKQAEPDNLELENASNDTTLFTLLNMNAATTTDKAEKPLTSFTSILSQIQKDSTKVPEAKPKQSFIPVDWTLKTKLRLTSSAPFAWSQQLRTCEEASGITGFVRCVPTGDGEEGVGSLDTSATARFHQCCLVWQHPALPWLALFPRTSGRVSDGNAIGTDQRMRDALYEDFTESFRSLFQLVRARQCPYFYVCANAFTCLFRAAGIGGHSDIHALLTPTTRGFRQLLKEDDVVFSMPLRRQRNLPGAPGSESQGDAAVVGEPAELEEEEDDWLESMGVGADVIKRLNKKQANVVFEKERSVDRTPESLVCADGVEAQALFNFLLNCKSIVAQTGALAGVTPTLLAPVAFHGATLKPLKARHSIVRGEGSLFHSVELRGPVLPHVVHQLCHLAGESRDEFSAAFVNLEPTLPFSLATAAQAHAPPEAAVFSPSKAPSAFGKESLSDCGLPPAVLSTFCCGDVSRVLPMDNIKRNRDGTYTW